MVLMLSAIDTADRRARLRVEVPYAVTFEGLTTITELILDSPRQIPDTPARSPSVIPTWRRRRAGKMEFISVSSSNFIFPTIYACPADHARNISPPTRTFQ